MSRLFTALNSITREDSIVPVMTPVNRRRMNLPSFLNGNPVDKNSGSIAPNAGAIIKVKPDIIPIEAPKAAPDDLL